MQMPKRGNKLSILRKIKNSCDLDQTVQERIRLEKEIVITKATADQS